MTLCIAALADERSSIVIAADKMVSISVIESELPISKVLKLHPNWWAMVAASPLPGAFPIVDNVAGRLDEQSQYSVDDVAAVVVEEFRRERLARAEAEHLGSRGLTLERFHDQGREILPDLTYREVDRAITSFAFQVSFLVAGFDAEGVGRVFSVQTPGISDRHDIPGFHAIGSGLYGAMYMMYYREIGPSTPLTEALYYVYEAKAFGELASGVGYGTDMFIMRKDRPLLRVDRDGLQPTLDQLWDKKQPGELDGRDRRRLRNLLERLETAADLESGKP